MEMGPPFYARGHPNQEQGKGSTFILVRPCTGIEPTASCSAVKRSTDWANPGEV